MPGIRTTPLTPEELEKLRQDNIRISNQAIKMANEQKEADARMGKRPVLHEVADSIKDKLQVYVDQHPEEAEDETTT